MIKIEGYVTKAAIKKWLKTYHEFGKKGTDYSQLKSGSPAVQDGWTGGKINKVMLTAAMEKIPDKVTKYIAYGRWIKLIPKSQILKGLKAAGISVNNDAYYRHCDKAVDFIHTEINGERKGTKNLLKAILD